MGNKELPRVVLVTPELLYLPRDEGTIKYRYGRKYLEFKDKEEFIKRGGLADMTSSLAIGLKSLGVNVAVGLPNIKKEADKKVGDLIEGEIESLGSAGISYWKKNLYLVEDPYFRSYRRLYEGEGKLFSLAFQRGILNKVIPSFKPDLIHTHDWLTGFIGALSYPGIKSLHTVHNFHTERIPMWLINEFGLPMYNSEKLWLDNYDYDRVNFQMSGIFGSDWVNVPSEGFHRDVLNGNVPGSFDPNFLSEYWNKNNAGRAGYVLNAPDSSYSPEIDTSIPFNFSLDDVMEGKRLNKLNFQRELGLYEGEEAPLLVWTNRADPHQKGIQFLDQILPHLMNRYQYPGLQMAVISDGEYIPVIKKTIHNLQDNGFQKRLAIRGWSDVLERKAYAAGDGLLNFSLWAPCELPQMKGPKYGCIPIVRGVGGLRDTVFHNRNGIVTNNYDSNSMIWAINEFQKLFSGNNDSYRGFVHNVKKYADENFTVSRMAKQYINLYERILDRKVC